MSGGAARNDLHIVIRDMALQSYHIPSISVVLAEHGFMLIHQMEVGSLLYLVAQVSKQNLLWCYIEYPYLLNSSEDTQLKAVNKQSYSDKYVLFGEVWFGLRAWLLFNYVFCFVCLLVFLFLSVLLP